MSQFGEVATVFGKVGTRRHRHRSRALLDGRDHVRLRPRAEWPRIARTRWYSGWAPGPLKRLLRLVWPDATPRTTAELVEELDQAVRLPGWTSAWTAPARARMDMMATGVRTPVGIRIVSPDPTRLDALGTAVRALVAALAGTRSAVFESLGGETWPALAVDPAALARHDVDPERRPRRPSICSPPAARSARSTRTGGACACGSRPSLPTCAHGAWPTSCARSPSARRPRGRRPGNRCRSACSGVPTYVRRPAALRTEHGELCAYVYVDLLAGHRSAGLRRARAPRGRRGDRNGRASSSLPASASSGRASTICSSQDRSGSTGSSRSSRCRCSGCCSCSSATSPRR